jgi:D-sedoheptulose 7-phosphate isomerase
MDDQHLRRVIADLEYSRKILADSIADESFVRTVADASRLVTEVLRRGNKVLLAGNGGSAADAQHIAGELLSRFNFDRAPLPAIALTTDTSVLTAIGNDYGYEQTFSRQVTGLGVPGDLFVGISTSGRSPNIIAGFEAARRKGLATLGLTGRNNGRMHEVCDLLICVPCDKTPFIQQVHLTAAHAICAIVESEIFSLGKH